MSKFSKLQIGHLGYEDVYAFFAFLQNIASDYMVWRLLLFEQHK